MEERDITIVRISTTVNRGYLLRKTKTLASLRLCVFALKKSMSQSPKHDMEIAATISPPITNHYSPLSLPFPINQNVTGLKSLCREVVVR